MTSIYEQNIVWSNLFHSAETMNERIERYKSYIKDLWNDIKKDMNKTDINKMIIETKFEELMCYKYYLAELKQQNTL